MTDPIIKHPVHTRLTCSCGRQRCPGRGKGVGGRGEAEDETCHFLHAGRHTSQSWVCCGCSLHTAAAFCDITANTGLVNIEPQALGSRDGAHKPGAHFHQCTNAYVAMCALFVLSLIDTFSQQHETHWNEAGLKSALLSPEALLHSGT